MSANGSAPAPGQTRGKGKVDTSELTGVVGYRLRRAQLKVFQDFIDSFAEIGLRPADYAVILMISENPGCKQAEIAAALGIKRANFVGLMNRIEARGFAERRQRSQDRRSHALFLTPAGEDFVVRMREIQAEHEARLVTALGGPEARDQFLGYLDRILAGGWGKNAG